MNVAMTPEQINEDLARAFSAYATATGRAWLVLGNRLAVLRGEAKLARMLSADFDRMARAQMETADARMRKDAARLHPATVAQKEAS